MALRRPRCVPSNAGCGPEQALASASRLMENPPAEGAAFTYYLHTSPFRIYRGEFFALKGWAWPQDGRGVTQVRANVGGRLFTGRGGSRSRR